MDDARLMYVIMSALDTTASVIKKRDEDENWVFGVMVTQEEIEEAKRIIGERFTEGASLAGSSSPLEKASAYAFGTLQAAYDAFINNEIIPKTAVNDALVLLQKVLWPPKEEED